MSGAYIRLQAGRGHRSRPYGLAVAAHLRGRGIPVRVFGDVMATWRDNMPAGMFLKSTPDASSISAPAAGFTLAAFCTHSGLPPLGEDEPVPVDLFIRYGQWFAEQLVPGVERRQVRRLSHDSGGFQVTLDDGEELETDTVVMANGVVDFAYLPAELAAAVPAGLAEAEGFPQLAASRSDRVLRQRRRGDRSWPVGAGNRRAPARSGRAGLCPHPRTGAIRRPAQASGPRAGAAAAEAAFAAGANLADLPVQPRCGDVRYLRRRPG